MRGPAFLDQIAFTGWMTGLYAAIAVPLYGVWRGAQRLRRGAS